MIPTENKNNAENFDATKTFSVPAHTAQSLKNRINQANEQSLKYRTPNPAANASHPQLPPARNRPAAVSAAKNPAAQNSTAVQAPAQRNPHPQTSSSAPVPAPQKPHEPQSKPAAQHPQTPAVRNSSLVQKAAAPVPEAPSEPSGIVKRSAEVRSLESMQMAKTRSVKVTSPAPKKKEEKKKKEKEYVSDEGGNTVVSVVKAIVYIIFVIIVSVALAIVSISVGNDVFAFVKSDEAVDITIPEYATLDEVANILYQNDIIKYPKVFKLYSVFKKYDQDFLAGEYSVNGMMNYDTLLTEFKEKPVTGTVRLTIPEGFTVDEIINLFVENGIGTREEFVRVMEEEEFDYWFLREQAESADTEDCIYRLEGYLFPDTYEFYKSSSEYTVLNKMLKRFGQIFSREYRTQCEELGYTVDQIVTLASLIEKEAASPSEFFLVSSVFHNRLGNPWGFPRLESDATVAYLLQHENNGVRVAVKASDLYLDNPYNTYQSDGLPPGPIANPSASAILAALSPQATPYYYFVANAGKTYFSATRAEHEDYIAQFRDPSYVAAIPKADIPGEEISGGIPLTQQENWKAVNAEANANEAEQTPEPLPWETDDTPQWQPDTTTEWQPDTTTEWQPETTTEWQPETSDDSGSSAETDSWFTSGDWYNNP